MRLELKLCTDDGVVIAVSVTPGISSHAVGDVEMDFDTPIMEGDSLLGGIKTTFRWLDKT